MTSNRPITPLPPTFSPPLQPLHPPIPHPTPNSWGYSRIDSMPKRLQQTDQAIALLYHARYAAPFFSRDGQPCASIPAGSDSRRILPIRSADFRDWLTANYYSEFESAPSDPALRSALRTLEARAQYGDTPVQKID